MQDVSRNSYNKLSINFDISKINNLDNIINFSNVKTCKIKFDDIVKNLKYQEYENNRYRYVDINSHLHSQR